MIKKMILSICVLVGVFISNSAMADYCVPGEDNSDPFCSSAWGRNTPGSDNSGTGNSGPVYVPPTVVDLWGAVAFDNATNTYGYSLNAGSRSEAKEKAVKDCGTKSCDVIATYGNSCAAFVGGYKPEGGFLWAFRRHANLNVASEKAMNDCNAHANSCKVLMAECSRI